MAEVRISDDFDLKKIAESGQCFRAKEISPGLFRFVTMDHAVYIKNVREKVFNVSCNELEWESTWADYFDLETNYAAAREEIVNLGKNKPFGEYLKKVTDFGKGIRILKQEPFETLISFIISQRKSIPAIRHSVELICEKFGRPIKTERGRVFSFPGVVDIAGVSPFELSSFALGYRGSYVKDAIEKVRNRVVALDEMRKYSDESMLDELKKIRGVGDKVAACVALYAYHRMNILPVDVWIGRAIDEDFNGENIFSEFEEKAGLLQQYVFFYKRAHSKDFEVMQDDDKK